MTLSANSLMLISAATKHLEVMFRNLFHFKYINKQNLARKLIQKMSIWLFTSSNECYHESFPEDIEKMKDWFMNKTGIKYKKILINMKNGETITFQVLLERCQLDNHQYMQAIRSSLKRKCIFLKRTSAEIRVNAYCPNLLPIWKANTDIQFVIDPYACCVYIASYIMKFQKGISRLLQTAVDETRCGNHSVKEKLQIKPL